MTAPAITPQLIDTSAIGRAAKPEVAAALKRLRGRPATCTTVALEMLHSARNPPDFERLTALLGQFQQLAMNEQVMDVARDLQARTMATGNHRCAGPIDILTAATAITHGATVVHYDRDFEQLASLHPGLHSQWIVPRGSIS